MSQLLNVLIIQIAFIENFISLQINYLRNTIFQEIITSKFLSNVYTSISMYNVYYEKLLKKKQYKKVKPLYNNKTFDTSNYSSYKLHK